MKQLKNSEIWRGSRDLTCESREISIDTSRFGREISLSTSIRSKGGGHTRISLEIGEGDFPRILEYMTKADPKQCLNAMFGEIKRREKAAEKAVVSVVRKARSEEYEETLSAINDEFQWIDMVVSDAYWRKPTEFRRVKKELMDQAGMVLRRIVNKMSKRKMCGPRLSARRLKLYEPKEVIDDFLDKIYEVDHHSEYDPPRLRRRRRVKK